MYHRICLCLALSIFPVHGAGDAALDRATLKGLKAAGVVIDNVDPVLEQQGLTAPALQQRLEQRLKNAGFTIDPSAMEFLGLRVIATHTTKKAPYGLSVTIGLYQPVILSRNKEVRTATQTWEAGTILVVPSKQLIPSYNEAADRLADQFTAAWRSVNPETRQ